MKKILLVVMCIAFVTSTGAFADEKSHKESVLKLLEITNARSMSDQMVKSVEAMMEQQLRNVAKDFPPEGQKAMEAVQGEGVKWLSENLSWEQMRDVYVDVYTQVFTEKEIRELIGFYQSPVGQKMIAKMPELLQTSMLKTQALIQGKLPELQELIKKRLSELEAKYKK